MCHEGAFFAARGLSSCGTQASVIVARGLNCSHDSWDLSYPTRDRTHSPGIGRLILNHRTTREVPTSALLLFPGAMVDFKSQLG